MKKINKESGIALVIVLLIVLGIVGVSGGAVFVMTKNRGKVMISSSPTPVLTSSPQITPTSQPSPPTEAMSDQKPEIKEFSMTSWYEMKDGKASANFSLKEIKVKKGETVRIKVTNTKGNHDFSLDEYSIKKLTPLDQEVAIEFKADKAGGFKYYCSMTGHRMMGQEGTLIVEE